MRKSLAERVVHCEGYPLWEDGDDEPLAVSGAGSGVTRGQVRVYLNAVQRGERQRDALAMAGFGWGTFMNICRQHTDVMREYVVMQESAAASDEQRAIEVLEEAAPESAQLANYLSLAYRWRAGVRNRKRYGEHRDAPTEVRVGVVILPAPSWGREAGPVVGEVIPMPRIAAGE